ncbi:MAG TPA: SGNH/GDSL hydrolase family protein [Phototrophicaceae bacterium]|jgi:lysophospholipase L1-like esterase|nr:SGNH/GDSL hydrolase family protein [Phototrophicaceae bacterium]
MKLIFLGNSLTEGIYGGNFVTQIAAKLAEHTVINAGVGGDTIVNVLERLEEVIAQEPDAIFVMCVENDAISYQYPAMRLYYQYSKNIPDGIVSPDTYARTYRQVFTRLQETQSLLWVGLSISEYSPELLETMRQYNALAAEVARDLKIPVLDLTTHLDTSHIPARPPMSARVIELIAQRGADGWNDYENERQRGGFKYTFDGVHLTPTTATLFADEILKFLKSSGAI